MCSLLAVLGVGGGVGGGNAGSSSRDGSLQWRELSAHLDLNMIIVVIPVDVFVLTHDRVGSVASFGRRYAME